MNRKNKQVDVLIERMFEMLTNIPEPQWKGKPSDDVFVRNLIRQSAIKSSSVSAALSLPGGVAGLVSVIPDVMTVWRIQSQMISNVAAAYGKNTVLTREQLLWCMFRQVGVGIVKDLVVQQGGSYLVRHYSKQQLPALLRKISAGLVQGQATRWAGRLVPLVGSLSAGALSYYDTYRVGQSAKQLYSQNVILLPPAQPS